MSIRKNVSLRVSEHPQSYLINQWLDEQKNIQESLTNIIMHMIERFGTRNITDYDIQKLLYQDSTASTSVGSAIPPVQGKEQQEIVINEPPGLVMKKNTIVKEKVKSEPEEEDMYGDLDVNNL